MTRRSKDIFRQQSKKRPPPHDPEVAAEQESARGDEPAEAVAEQPGGLRLQKVMAAAGVGSRRHCEELIVGGRVEVDGRTVKKLGTKVEPARQTIRVDGQTLKLKHAPAYFLVNKPDGVVSTNSDPSGRTRVMDLVPQIEGEHLFTVGRLDMSSEGLILVTNDGELANQLTHPRYGVEKTYVALVAGQISAEQVDQLREGVHLAEGLARCVSVHVRKTLPQSTLLEIVLNEGKNREIRRILAKVGHKVLKLKRTAIGRVKLRDLKVGECRRLTRDELKSLREAAKHGSTRRRPPPRRDRKPKAVAATTDVTPIIDTRERKSSGKFPSQRSQKDGPKRGGRSPARRPPGSGTVIGAD